MLPYYYLSFHYDMYYYDYLKMNPIINITIILLWWTLLSQSTHLVIYWKIPSLVNLASIFNNISRIKMQLISWLRETYQWMISYFIVGWRQRLFIQYLVIFSSTYLMIWYVSRSSSRWYSHFPFLRTKDLCTSLLIMRTHGFLLTCKYGVHTQG